MTGALSMTGSRIVGPESGMDGGVGTTGGTLARAIYIAREGLGGFCRSKRVATVLACLCFALGVGAFVVLLSAGAGASRDGVVAITHFGADRITVHGFSRDPMVAPVDLDMEDIHAVAQHVANVRVARPARQWRKSIRHGDRATSGHIIATDFPQHERPMQGVWYSPEDGRDVEAVVVIGPAIKEALFDHGADPLGAFLLIGGQPFIVKGVLGRDSRAASAVYIPYQSAMALLEDPPPLSMHVLVDDPVRIEASALAIRAMLMVRHGREGFTLLTDAGSIDGWKTMRRVFNGILVGIGVFGALLGMVGMVNVVLLSVRRRTKEIGIRMAMGAGRGHIAAQFLVEATTVAVVGSIVGVALAALMVSLLMKFHVPIDFQAQQLVIATSGATLSGLLAGVLPAWKAARLDPCNALAND